ncbi:MAG TPA: NAD(P)/FAD-dependent oxidoreductase [Candidatus Diapherotrites archaeon]|uniref:NAD(P)/FAD-dependent oxidoreductase n=1 Tax=Candidatus Iainarchaeum sp. TaxID=3101447 RepID=A0A7J4JHN6_9ARCH|nr:NAD(P)/FAD-dependent oxidoreductase [Candidatus Diapherotrites archaeon]HIH16099.1 NAD(P)/FAD-dependent oxidoreductase [Candidatus Diapherotrites archaeon]
MTRDAIVGGAIVDVLVVGAGPAGLSASIQLQRMGFKPLVLEKNRVGGLLRNARWVENFLGFPDGLAGKRLAALFERQARAQGVEVRKAVVTGVTREKNGFVVRAGRKRFRSRALVLATGTAPRPLGVPGEKALAGKKLFYSVEEMPALKRGQARGWTLAVIGSGDIAFDYALNLADQGIRVRLLLRGSKPKCIPRLRAAVGKHPRIAVYPHAVVRGLSSQGHKALLEVAVNGRRQSMSVDRVLAAVGRQPCLDFLPRAWQKRLRREGRALEGVGLCLAGDADANNFRHAGIAMGEGLRAAMFLGGFLSHASSD